jgi:hypothetical protein
MRHLTSFHCYGVRGSTSAVLFDHASGVLVLAKSDKLRMSQPIGLRFILHRFMAKAAQSETMLLLDLESA